MIPLPEVQLVDPVCPMTPSALCFVYCFQNNIKEVLLFPAMKPDDTTAQQSTTRGLGMAQQTASSPGVAPPAAYPPMFASGSRLLDGVDLASPTGTQKLEVRPCGGCRCTLRGRYTTREPYS